jgi:hypothetical protein
VASAIQYPPRWPTREQAEAAFFDAVRGGRPTPGSEQVRALPDAELTRLTRRLLRLRRECGCQAGACCLTAALIAAPVIATVHGASGLTGVLGLALLSCGCVIGAAVLGKVATIAVFRLRWRTERNQVLRQLAERGAVRDVILR